MSAKIVLITGANSGVGYATSAVLGEDPAKYHVIMAGRSLEKVEAAKAEIEALGNLHGSLSAVQLEVTDEASIRAAAAAVERDYGALDVLINNAGVGSGDADVKTRFRRCLDTNVLGPALVADAFRPLLLRSSHPYSIYVGSGQRTLPRNALQKHAVAPPGPTDAYQVSKAALNMLAVLELRDYGDQGLKVFVVSPGFVVSNLRGPGEAERTGWGHAEDARISGQIFLEVIQGKRDAQVGCLVHKDGTFDW